MTTPPDHHAKPGSLPTASPHAAGDADLPSDAAELRIQGLLAALSKVTAAYETLQHENETLQHENQSVKQENELLRQELERYRRYVYGRRSERLDDPGQGHLFELG